MKPSVSQQHSNDGIMVDGHMVDGHMVDGHYDGIPCAPGGLTMVTVA
jgi:hypothetical protein